MEGRRLIRSLKLKNLLSYGNEGVDIELQPLNILVGPNGSGKSNLLEAIRLLHAAPSDITKPIINGGGINDWLWKGERAASLQPLPSPRHDDTRPSALIELLFDDEAYNAHPDYELMSETQLRHCLSLNVRSEKFYVANEIIESAYAGTTRQWYSNDEHNSHATLLGVSDAVLLGFSEIEDKFVPHRIEHEKLKRDQSILSQRNDPNSYPQLEFIRQMYSSFKVYSDAFVGRGSAPRLPQSADADASFLSEDYSNMALVLNEMQLNVGAFHNLLTNLQAFYERVEKISTRVSYGTVQLYFQEKGLQQLVPATRFSDGTLRYLCLLAILCHPAPPPLICIEEPELGLHPDILPPLAKLLVEASQRTQLIVTTHSDILLSEFTDIPESVIVCDRNDDGSSLKHLNSEDLQIWLRDYSLGEAWLKNAFGGTRW